MLEEAERANQLMVDRLIAQGALWSPLIIAAFRATRRDLFIDRVFRYQGKDWRETITRDPDAERLALIYSDQALTTHLRTPASGLPAVPDSSSSQPSLMAQMLEYLELRRGMRVLEIGTGTGYNAALIAHAVGPNLVTSIDVSLETVSEAWEHLRKYASRGVKLVHGDGRAGVSASTPYDRIIVTAATPDLQPAWLAQLKNRGLLVAPLDLARGLAFVLRGRTRDGTFNGRLCQAAYFMPLRAADNHEEEETASSYSDARLSMAPAPWSNWLERKRLRSTLSGLRPAFALFALLHRLDVRHATAHGEDYFGIGLESDVCWLGHEHWRFTSIQARDRALKLWREFLDLGAPRPNEFRIHFAPVGFGKSAAILTHSGPNFMQQWSLPARRQRGYGP